MNSKKPSLPPLHMFGSIAILATQGHPRFKRPDCDQSGERNYDNAVASVPGEPIAHLQALLIGLGAQIEADGVFGKDTQEALEQLIGKSDYDLARGDLAVLSDLYVHQLVKVRAPSTAAPDEPTAAAPALSIVEKDKPDLDAAGPGKLPIFFRQADPDWENRELGKGKTIGEVGCAMCCCAMVAAHAAGASIQPAPRAEEADSPINHLDAFLDHHDGYDGNSIYWSKVCEFIAQHGVTVRYDRVRGLDREGYFHRIRELLAEGVFPIVRILHARGLHFMLAVRATEGGSILVNDPGSQHGDGRTDNPANILQSMDRYGSFTVQGLDFYRVA